MSNLAEAYRDNPQNPHHIIPLDFNSVDALPESHSWVESGEIQSVSEERESIPIIDLSDPNAAKLVGRALESWGMIQVINHDIPQSLIDDVESEARRFFSLPVEQKVKILRSPDGATGYGVARIAPFFSKFMWHEGLTIMGSSVEHARELWPHDYQRFCDVMDNYQKKMKALAYQLMLLILKSLDVSQQDMNWATSTEGALQLNSYPPCPDPDRALGLAPHTDTLFLTILHSQMKGLQVFRDGIEWVPVSPMHGGLIINVGDLLHILSNGKLCTPYHRVVVNQSRQRISWAYFFGPSADLQVAPLNVHESPPQYRAVSVKEYVGIKNKHLEEALELIKI